jgi:ATP-dependent DNA ligase
MGLPFDPPLAPMLSSAADALPGGDGWQFEPKWDGFRTLVFRDGGEVLLQSRDEKPMNRYFPELVAPLIATLPERCVVDGEIVIVGADGLDFEALLLRIHPGRLAREAAGRPDAGLVRCLGPARAGDEDLRETPLAARRERSSGRWPARARRCISRRHSAIARSPRTGSAASRGPGWTASWPSDSTRPIAPASAR